MFCTLVCLGLIAVGGLVGWAVHPGGPAIFEGFLLNAVYGITAGVISGAYVSAVFSVRNKFYRLYDDAYLVFERASRSPTAINTDIGGNTQLQRKKDDVLSAADDLSEISNDLGVFGDKDSSSKIHEVAQDLKRKAHTPENSEDLRKWRRDNLKKIRNMKPPKFTLFPTKF